MQLQGREFNFGKTINGFNGQLRDNDIHKDHHTALFWEYDPRLGRRWNIDPVGKAMVSPYVVLGDNPIIFIDPLGNDWYKNNKAKNDDGLVWFEGSGRHKGFTRDKRGQKFWTDRNENNVSTYYGTSADDIAISGSPLESVTVTDSRRSKRSGANAAFPFVDRINSYASQEWSSQRYIYEQARIRGMSHEDIQQTGAFQENRLENFEHVWQAKENGRTTQLVAMGIILAPITGIAAVETGAIYYTGSALSSGRLLLTDASLITNSIIQIGANSGRNILIRNILRTIPLSFGTKKDLLQKIKAPIYIRSDQMLEAIKFIIGRELPPGALPFGQPIIPNLK